MVSSLTRAIGEMNADIEELVEQFGDKYVESFEKLLVSIDGRYEPIWQAAEADPSVDLSDFGSVPVSSRDDVWRESVTAMFAAAQIQALAECGALEALVKLSETNGDTVNAAASRLSADEIREVVAELPGSQITETVRSERGQVAR